VIYQRLENSLFSSSLILSGGGKTPAGELYSENFASVGVQIQAY
jgi:hypothetical protein